jgi:hypothetical protein
VETHRDHYNFWPMSQFLACTHALTDLRGIPRRIKKEGHGFSHAVKQAGSTSFRALCRPAMWGGRGRGGPRDSAAFGTTKVVPFRCLASPCYAVLNRSSHVEG